MQHDILEATFDRKIMIIVFTLTSKVTLPLNVQIQIGYVYSWDTCMDACFCDTQERGLLSRTAAGNRA